MELAGTLWSLMPSRTTGRAASGTATPDEVLTIKEVAALLNLAEKTVYAMANEGELPAFKIAGNGGSVARNSSAGWTSSRGGGRHDDA